MFCEYCGKQLPDNSRFCDNCGKKVTFSMDETVIVSERTQVCDQGGNKSEYFVEEECPTGNEKRGYSNLDNRYPDFSQNPRYDQGRTDPAVYPEEYEQESSSNTMLYVILGAGAVILAVLAIAAVLIYVVLSSEDEKYEYYVEAEVDEGPEDVLTLTPTPTIETIITNDFTTPVPSPKIEEPYKGVPKNEEPEKVVVAPKKKESTYIFVKKNCTWLEAHTYCVAQGGHLVHFDEEGEAEKVIAQFTAQGFDQKSMFWIGGARDSAGDSTVYHWVNADGTFGKEISFAHSLWMQGEPSYIDPGLDNAIEDKLMLFFYKDAGRWVMNDETNNPQDYMPNYAKRIGYICEIEQ